MEKNTLVAQLDSYQMLQDPDVGVSGPTSGSIRRDLITFPLDLSHSNGATAFCIIRSYLSTMRKQGRSILAVMAAVFAGAPFPIAWATE
ncbi:hypothetical protein KDAU_08440 [Dictyobacter aurantiacus]|uniref:Uncharacterized protein n=1 Tax=Dictyobacter aurantiacus TaxID=1936993 RepID=A0A401Z9I9_9CHLR|nr:hypothetical protein KDAU_08440 [Dictyobacter aurantiacus]